MTDIGKFVDDLTAAGCIPKVAARVVAEAFAAGVQAGPFKDEAAEKRRAWDRERKAKKRKSAESGGNPVETDHVRRVWTEGVGLLQQLGMAEGGARKNIGLWLKRGNEPARVFEIVRQAHEKRIGNPVPWITMGLNNGNGKATGNRRRSLSDAADDLIARSESFGREVDADAADDSDPGFKSCEAAHR